MRQPQDEQICQYRNAKGLFHLIPVPPYLVLAQSEVRFQVPLDELDVIVTSHKIRMVRPSRVFILQRTQPPRP
jgi:hypothetical protein